GRGEGREGGNAYAGAAQVEGGEPVETDQDDASHAAQSYESTPSLFSAATWSAPMPSQAFSTSALCWPRPGDGLIRAVMPSSRTGQVGILNGPFGWSMTCMMPRFSKLASFCSSIVPKPAPAGP